MAGWPDLKEVRTFLRLAVDPVEDQVVDTARLAAVAFGQFKLGSDPANPGQPLYPSDTDQLPDGAHQAALIHAARLYKRRDSLDGTVGWSDVGVVRIGSRDPDVAALYDQLAPVVFG